MRQVLEIVALEDFLQNGQVRPENLLVGYAGIYLYVCRVDEASEPFADGDTGRIGIIFAIPSRNLDGRDVCIRWWGLRLGHTTDGIQFEPVQSPFPWEGAGSLSLDEGGHLQATYILSNGSNIGISVDRLRPDGRNGDWSGTFEATVDHGREIQGRVRHTRLVNVGETPPEFKSVPVRLWDILSDERIGDWGRALYNVLPEEDRATPDEPYVDIDLVSGDYIRLSKRDRLAAGMRFRENHPGAVMYTAEANDHVVPVAGVGPVR